MGACLVAAVAACTSSESSGQRVCPPRSVAASASVGVGGGEPSSVPSGVAELSCAASIDARPHPPANYRVVVQNVAVPTAPVLQANASGETDPAVRLFAKWGLVVRTGAAIDLQVAPGWEDRALIGWGRQRVPTVSVHVPACPGPSAQAQWLGFAGGTWVAQPACVPLIVRSHGQEARVHLGIGVACAVTPGG